MEETNSSRGIDLQGKQPFQSITLREHLHVMRHKGDMS